MEGTGKENKAGRLETVEIAIRRLPGDRTDVFALDHREGLTLQAALQYIYENLDDSLAFRPYKCGKGVCMSCVVSVNGKKRQACNTILHPGDRLLVEAAPGCSCVRDVVVV